MSFMSPYKIKLMHRYLRYLLFSLFLHTAILLGVCISPHQPKQSQSKVPFKEKFVAPLPSSTSPQTISTHISQPILQPQPPSQYKLAPKPEPKTQKIQHKPKAPPKPKVQTSPQKPSSFEQLHALAQLAETLSQRIEKTESSLETFSLCTPSRLTMTSSLEETQENELCEVFRKYLTLPSPGEVRIKITLSPSGSIEECIFLSSISPADKHILMQRIHSLPFQKFFSKYKLSKNISFHIKLLSNEI